MEGTVIRGKHIAKYSFACRNITINHPLPDSQRNRHPRVIASFDTKRKRCGRFLRILRPEQENRGVATTVVITWVCWLQVLHLQQQVPPRAFRFVMQAVPLTSKPRDQRPKRFSLFRHTMNRFPLTPLSHYRPLRCPFLWIKSQESFVQSRLLVGDHHRFLLGHHHQPNHVR